MASSNTGPCVTARHGDDLLTDTMASSNTGPFVVVIRRLWPNGACTSECKMGFNVGDTLPF